MGLPVGVEAASVTARAGWHGDAGPRVEVDDDWLPGGAAAPDDQWGRDRPAQVNDRSGADLTGARPPIAAVVEPRGRTRVSAARAVGRAGRVLRHEDAGAVATPQSQQGLSTDRPLMPGLDRWPPVPRLPWA